MKKKVISYGLILIVIFAVGFVVFHRNKVKPVGVKVTKAVTGNIKSYLSTTGTVKSKNQAEYYGTQAKVKRVKVKVGDTVQRGEALVVYDISDILNAAKQAEIQYSNAALQRDDLKDQSRSINSRIADLDKQISDLEESTNLADKTKAETLKQQRGSLIPISDEKIKLADNAVELAKLALDSARQRLSDNKGTLYASSNGVVTAVNVTEGTVGNAMQPAVEVQDVKDLTAEVSLGKFDASRVRLGQSVTLKYGNSIYNGRVNQIAPIASKPMIQGGGDAALTVDIDILDKAPELKIGFDVDIDILTGEVNNVVKIPAECLMAERNDKNLAYVLEGNIIHERNVKVGLRSDTEAEIQSGIKPGEKVILNPSASMAEGVRGKEE